ncbi:hypothetical protein N9Q05_02290, partial [bacterium]|nr:hypothetical protein [bacterium]
VLLLNIMKAYFQNKYDQGVYRVRPIFNITIETLYTLSINKIEFCRHALTIHKTISGVNHDAYNLPRKSYILDYLAIFSEFTSLEELNELIQNEIFEPPNTGICAVLQPYWCGNNSSLYPTLGSYGVGYIRVYSQGTAKDGLYFADKWTGAVRKLPVDAAVLTKLDECKLFTETPHCLNEEQLAEIKSVEIHDKPYSRYDSSGGKSIWQEMAHERALVLNYGQHLTEEALSCRGDIAKPTAYLTILANDVSLEMGANYKVDANMPLLLQLLPEDRRDAMSALYLTAERINAHALEAQQIDLNKLFMLKQTVISNYVSLMGLDGIAQLRSRLAGTVLSLERYCDNLPTLPPAMLEPLTSYYQSHQTLIKENQDEANAWNMVLMTLSTLLNMYGHKGDTFIQELLQLSDNRTPSDCSNALARALLKHFLHQMQLHNELQELTVNIDEINVQTLFNRIPHDKFTKLVNAYSSMHESPYKAVFLHLFKLDLTGGSIEKFFNEINQDDPLGKILALHNQSIRNQLRAQNIDPISALNYKKTIEYIVFPDVDYASNHMNSLVVLWSYATPLKKAVTEEISKLKSVEAVAGIQKNTTLINQLNSISNSIKTLEDLIQKNKKSESLHQPHILASILTTEENISLLKKIERNLNALKKNTALLSPQFKEFSNHFIENFPQGLSMKGDGSATKKYNLPHYFRVEQWSKESPMTFFLGDEVGCCLSTDGEAFPAMVERRLDDAVLFHVAIDQATGKPVALIWLYLAETTQGRVSLVANFFEVQAKYAQNEHLRLALLQILLSFTHQYCLDNPHIAGFYMNPLSYGWNLNDLNSYCIETLDIVDKLGGPFVPDVNLDKPDNDSEQKFKIKTYTKDLYYLASLCNETKQFHLFSPDILENTFVKGVCCLTSMIETWIKQSMPESLEKIQIEITQKHPVELAPFFNLPLEENEGLKARIKGVYEKIKEEKYRSKVKTAVLYLREQGFLALKTEVESHLESSSIIENTSRSI